MAESRRIHRGIALGIMLRHDATAMVIAIAVTVMLFLALVKRHDNVITHRLREEALLKFAESRLQVLDGNLSGLPRGERYIDSNHPYTYDLDVFGDKSLFSLLDSTATPEAATNSPTAYDSLTLMPTT